MATSIAGKVSPKLTIDGIVDHAWNLVERDGLAGLSTRRLATELGVQSPALYWHVKNKKELLGLMIERVLEGSIASIPEEKDWRSWLYKVGLEQHRILLSHRDGGIIASVSAPTERMRNEVFKNAIDRLVHNGVARERAAAIWGGLASLVLGAVIYQQNQDVRAFARIFGEPETTFKIALEAYVKGLGDVTVAGTEQEAAHSR